VNRVLIVDDEREILDLLTKHFAGRYAVDTATSGAQAVASFVRQRPDVVFLDVNVPGTVEVLKLFRQTDTQVPVIMVTENAEIRVAEECLKSGAFAWVPKPLNLAYMDHMAAVAAAQKRKRARS
jgi:DNA-binding NtrC family response regulator